MAAVWDMDLPRDQKFILLAYADHADHDGGNIYPAVALIARKTGYSVRSVQTVAKELVSSGRLVPDGRGPHGTRRWRMPLYVPGADSAPLPIGGKETQPSAPETQPAALRGAVATAPEPSGTINEPLRALAPKNGRPRDELFDAISETCKVDPATTAASIGKVKQALLSSDPPYTPAEVKLFSGWWWGKDGMRKRPPTLWQLKEQIGVVRSPEVRKLAPRDPRALPETTKVVIPPYYRVEAK